MMRPLKWALGHAQRDIISKNRYGYDVLLDIERLSRQWGYPIRLVFDVGANDGDTIRSIRPRFPACNIIAFEPHPTTYLGLQERTVGIANVDLVNLALGAEHGRKTMFEYGQHSVLNSLVSDAQFVVRFGVQGQPILVDCTTLDQFCSERRIEAIDVLKIDTEGCDLDVLRGAQAMLERKAVKFVYFEFNDIHPRSGRSGGALAPVDEWLYPRGYRFIATYNDYLVSDGELFLVSNALYALPPSR